MAKAKVYTADTINKKAISDFLTTEKNLRDRLQNLLVASIAHAQKHNNDFTLLSHLVTGLKERRTRNLKAITQFVLDHVKGISWQKLGDGSYGYKSVKGATVKYLEIKEAWFNHKDNSQQVATLNLAGRIHGLISSIDKAIAGHMKADMSKEQLEGYKVQLGQLANQLQ